MAFGAQAARIAEPGLDPAAIWEWAPVILDVIGPDETGRLVVANLAWEIELGVQFVVEPGRAVSEIPGWGKALHAAYSLLNNTAYPEVAAL